VAFSSSSDWRRFSCFNVLLQKTTRLSKPLFVGARLAGESALKGAFAGKPGSYKSGPDRRVFFSQISGKKKPAITLA
jgi:hypothetical protein